MTDRTLSPAAQAIYDVWRTEKDGPWTLSELQRLAAALRAAVDQVVPEQELDDVPGRFVNGCCHSQRQNTRAQLLAIAAELEAHD